MKNTIILDNGICISANYETNTIRYYLRGNGENGVPALEQKTLYEIKFYNAQDFINYINNDENLIKLYELIQNKI